MLALPFFITATSPSSEVAAFERHLDPLANTISAKAEPNDFEGFFKAGTHVNKICTCNLLYSPSQISLQLV